MIGAAVSLGGIAVVWAGIYLYKNRNVDRPPDVLDRLAGSIIGFAAGLLLCTLVYAGREYVIVVAPGVVLAGGVIILCSRSVWNDAVKNIRAV